MTELWYYTCIHIRGVAPGAATAAPITLHGAAGRTNYFHGLSQALPIIQHVCTATGRERVDGYTLHPMPLAVRV